MTVAPILRPRDPLGDLLLPPFVEEPAPVVSWAERNVVVRVSDRPGRLILDAYQRPILEAMADQRAVQQVTMMLSSQLGKTLLMAVLMGWIIDQSPQSVLFMHASAQGLKKFLREKLEPILLGTPILNEKVERNNRNNIPNEGFSFGLGGYCTLTTARSKSAKHGTSASVVIADEIDDYEGTTKVSSLKQRSITFSQPTLVLASTPTLAGSSPIENEYAAGSQTIWYACCPYCEGPQQLIREQIKDGKLWCALCSRPWSEQDRVRAVASGFPADSVPNSVHKSFWISQLYSLNVPLEKTLRDSQTYSPMEFCTQILAWPYEEMVLAPVQASQIQRRPACFPVAHTTVGVDIQLNRIEYSIVQFDRFLTKKHLVQRGAILRTADYEVLHQLRREVSPFRPQRMTIDGGYDFDWLKKGLEVAFGDLFLVENPPIEIVRGYTNASFDRPLRGSKGHGYIWGATDEAKVLVAQDLASGALSLEPNLPADTEDQLTAEKLVRYEQAGRVKRAWRNEPKTPNEVLDCVVYAYIGVLALDIGEAYSPTLVSA